MLVKNYFIKKKKEINERGQKGQEMGGGEQACRQRKEWLIHLEKIYIFNSIINSFFVCVKGLVRCPLFKSTSGSYATWCTNGLWLLLLLIYYYYFFNKSWTIIMGFLPWIQCRLPIYIWVPSLFLIAKIPKSHPKSLYILYIPSLQ